MHGPARLVKSVIASAAAIIVLASCSGSSHQPAAATSGLTATSSRVAVTDSPPASTSPPSPTVSSPLSVLPSDDASTAPAGAPLSCRGNQLAVDFRGVAFGMGNAFANFVIRDSSPVACTLIGPITVVGMGARNAPVTQQVTLLVAAGLVLSADARELAPEAGPPPGVSIGWFQVAAVAVHAAPDGTCTDQVDPVNWSIVGARATFLVANGGASGDGLTVCDGRLEIPPTPDSVRALD